MYEVVFTADPRDERSPLHRSYDDALDYIEANAGPSEGYEVWQVAEDIDRTRVLCVLLAGS
jgi:hypothetical protein